MFDILTVDQFVQFRGCIDCDYWGKSPIHQRSCAVVTLGRVYQRAIHLGCTKLRK
jgi:hypothetical protein